MSNKSDNSNNSGIGLAGFVFLIFLVLKLTNVIDWSWWYVTMPLYGALVIFAVLALFIMIFKKD